METQSNSSTTSKTCSACGQSMQASARFCPGCGIEQRAQQFAATAAEATSQGDRHGMIISVNQMFCRGCGQPIHRTAPTCPHCGAPQNTGYQSFGITEGAGRSKVVAAVLALMLGGFGAHKFYLGQIGLGILYLVFFWTLIPSIVAFVEFIVYLSMSDEEFVRKYG